MKLIFSKDNKKLLIQVPDMDIGHFTIIEKAVEYNADAIGLSALLVSTSKQMPLIVNELARRESPTRILV